MFDVARALAILWALLRSRRARAWDGLAASGLVAYLFVLEVASGFSIRREGPQEFLLSFVLALLGPSAMPRGELPRVPFARLVVSWPGTVHVIAVAALSVTVVRVAGRAARMPWRAEKAAMLERVSLILVLNAVFEGLSCAARWLPYLLDRG